MAKSLYLLSASVVFRSLYNSHWYFPRKVLAVVLVGRPHGVAVLFGPANDRRLVLGLCQDKFGRRGPEKGPEVPGVIHFEDCVMSHRFHRLYELDTCFVAQLKEVPGLAQEHFLLLLLDVWHIVVPCLLPL
jgi:hypothetical protein